MMGDYGAMQIMSMTALKHCICNDHEDIGTFEIGEIPPASKLSGSWI
jgi:hypothetical protein